MNNATEIKILKETLSLNLVSKLRYQKLLSCTNDAVLIDWIESKIEMLTDFIFDLTIELNTKGSTYNRNLEMPFVNLFYSVKYSFLVKNGNDLITESQKLDTNLIERLNATVTGKTVSVDVKRSIEKEISGIINFAPSSLLSTLQLQ